MIFCCQLFLLIIYLVFKLVILVLQRERVWSTVPVFFFSPELEPIIFVIQRIDKILYRKGFLHRDTFNPGEKSLGQYCYIHIFLSFLGSLLKQCILFDIFLQLSPLPPCTKLKTRKKIWIHASNIACGVRGEVEPVWIGKCPRNASVPRRLSMIVDSREYGLN